MHPVSCFLFHSTDHKLLTSAFVLCLCIDHFLYMARLVDLQQPQSLLIQSVLIKCVFLLQRSPCAPTTMRSTSTRKMGPSGPRSMSWRSTTGRWQVRQRDTCANTFTTLTFIFTITCNARTTRTHCKNYSKYLASMFCIYVITLIPADGGSLYLMSWYQKKEELQFLHCRCIRLYIHVCPLCVKDQSEWSLTGSASKLSCSVIQKVRGVIKRFVSLQVLTGLRTVTV